MYVGIFSLDFVERKELLYVAAETRKFGHHGPDTT